MEHLKKTLTDVAAILAALTGIAAQWESVRKALPFLERIPAPYREVGSVILLALASLLFWRSQSLARARTPRGFTRALDIGNLHLEGREGDVERLLRCLDEFPLTWLVGESGSGKSSVLLRGVMPELQKNRNRLGVYVNNWGADWVEGPRRALVEALLNAVAEATLDVPRPSSLKQTDPFKLIRN